METGDCLFSLLPHMIELQTGRSDKYIWIVICLWFCVCVTGDKNVQFSHSKQMCVGLIIPNKVHVVNGKNGSLFFLKD